MGSQLSHSFFALALIACLATAASASQVSFVGASGPGLATMSFNSVTFGDPGNDNVAGASSNTISINQKAYGAPDFIDMVFDVSDTGVGDSEYQLTEGVGNGSGVDWIGYRVTLGFGTGAGFVQSALGDGLDFDASDEDSPYSFGVFTSLSIGEDVLVAGGGTMPNTFFDTFSFPIDVPANITQFTVRQEPRIVPEPSTAALAMLGLVGLGLRGRNRAR